MHDFDDYDYGSPHHHGEEEINLENNGLWLADNIHLKSVGIDIGSAGTQVIFSFLHLQRKGEDLSSRYIVVARETIGCSPVYLTPYLDDEKIDSEALGKIISSSYRQAGLNPKDIDTGAVILTGEAIRRENAQAIGDMLAAQGGHFVCAIAGHNMEAQLAAYGSGAARLSHQQGLRILNVDIGGGTTKLAVVENGRVVETAALYLGGRLVVFDEKQRIIRLDPGGKNIAELLGFSWRIGAFVDQNEMKEITSWMAEAILTAIMIRPLPEEIEKMFLTAVLQQVDHLDGVMFSGGVGEYVYNREKKDFCDLGKLLGQKLRRKIANGRLPYPLLTGGECIRATVVGASEHSVQVSGNTIYISNPDMLPLKNLQVLRPEYELTGSIEPHKIAQSIRDRYISFDLAEDEADVVVAFRWHGDPEYKRVADFVKGLVKGLELSIRKGKPIILVFDGDVARTIGFLLKEEIKIDNDIIVIDGIILQDFDFIDIGQWLYPSGSVPVTIKSLLFKL